jgi:hypothetical protein
MMRFKGMLWGSVASEFHGAGLPDLRLHRHEGILSGWPWLSSGVPVRVFQSILVHRVQDAR